MMNLRTWIKTVALAAFAPALPALAESESLLHIYRLDKNRCNPKRIRMQELKVGDLFIWNRPDDRFVSCPQRCCEAPRWRTDCGVPTWSVVCEPALT